MRMKCQKHKQIDWVQITALEITEELARIRKKEVFSQTLRGTISSLLVVAAIASLTATLLLPVLRVTGSSMTPTLQNDELVICTKRHDFQAGDIVAFYYNNKILLKRVIGTAGDVIDIDEEGTVYVNGEALEESYLQEKAIGNCDIELPYQVPESRIFVMGDHRSTSIDSRSEEVGCIAEEYVIGKVLLRIFPLSAFGSVT